MAFKIIKQFNTGKFIGLRAHLISFKITDKWNAGIVVKSYDLDYKSEISVFTPNWISMPVLDWMYP